MEINRDLTYQSPNLNKPQGASVSLCMIVKDEEENIKRALLSVRPVVDEMIVVDTGSTDRTKEIASRLGAKIYDFTWNDSFSDARNFSLSKATGDWILILDADELISPLDHGKLRELVETGKTETDRDSLRLMETYGKDETHGVKIADSKRGRHPREGGGPFNALKNMDSRLRGNDEVRADVSSLNQSQRVSCLKTAYSFTTRTYVAEMNTAGWTANDGSYINEEAGTGWFPGEKVRLFPNDSRFSFEFAVHERIEPSLMEAGIEIKRCDIPVHHYGNFVNKDRSGSKSEQYYQLGRRKLADTGEENFRAYFEIALLGAELGRYGEALEYLKKAVALKPDFSRAYQSMGNAYYNLGKYEEALHSYKKALELGTDKRDRRDALLMYATCGLLTGNAEQAIAVAEDLLKNKTSYPQAMLLLAEAYFCTGETGKGMQLVRILEDMRFGLGTALVKFAEMLVSAGRLQYALSLLKGAVESDVATEEAKALLEELKDISG